MSYSISVYEKKLDTEIKRIPIEYLPNLFEIVRAFRESILLKPANDSFKQGWKEALAGEVIPVSDLWENVDAR